jgi:hypothetical protein
LVKAENLDEAYDKVVAIGQSHKPYKAAKPPGIDVQWLFEGISDLLPIYEKIEDGCEVMRAEYTKKAQKRPAQRSR